MYAERSFPVSVENQTMRDGPSFTCNFFLFFLTALGEKGRIGGIDFQELPKPPT